jgi:hypothetical protein
MPFRKFDMPFYSNIKTTAELRELRQEIGQLKEYWDFHWIPEVQEVKVVYDHLRESINALLNTYKGDEQASLPPLPEEGLAQPTELKPFIDAFNKFYTIAIKIRKTAQAERLLDTQKVKFSSAISLALHALSQYYPCNEVEGNTYVDPILGFPFTSEDQVILVGRSFYALAALKQFLISKTDRQDPNDPHILCGNEELSYKDISNLCLYTTRDWLTLLAELQKLPGFQLPIIPLLIGEKLGEEPCKILVVTASDKAKWQKKLSQENCLLISQDHLRLCALMQKQGGTLEDNILRILTVLDEANVSQEEERRLLGSILSGNIPLADFEAIVNAALENVYPATHSTVYGDSHTVKTNLRKGGLQQFVPGSTAEIENAANENAELWGALRSGNHQYAEQLIRTGNVDLDKPNKDGWSFLGWVTSKFNNSPNALGTLVIARLQKQRKSERPSSLELQRELVYHIDYSNFQSVWNCLKEGANPNLYCDASKDHERFLSKGHTPFLYAVSKAAKTSDPSELQEALDIVSLLINYGAKLNDHIPTSNYFTPIILAITEHNSLLAKELLQPRGQQELLESRIARELLPEGVLEDLENIPDLGVAIEGANPNGLGCYWRYSPLILVVIYCEEDCHIDSSCEILQYLIEAGADIDKKHTIVARMDGATSAVTLYEYMQKVFYQRGMRDAEAKFLTVINNSEFRAQGLGARNCRNIATGLSRTINSNRPPAQGYTALSSQKRPFGEELRACRVQYYDVILPMQDKKDYTPGLSRAPNQRQSTNSQSFFNPPQESVPSGKKIDKGWLTKLLGSTGYGTSKFLTARKLNTEAGLLQVMQNPEVANRFLNTMLILHKMHIDLTRIEASFAQRIMDIDAETHQELQAFYKGLSKKDRTRESNVTEVKRIITAPLSRERYPVGGGYVYPQTQPTIR